MNFYNNNIISNNTTCDKSLDGLREPSRLRLRAGVCGDAEAMVALKQGLRMQADGGDDGGTSSRGGFLLGSTRAQYEAQLAGAQVEVLLDGAALVGFITALPDAALRASDLWQRRGQIGGGAIDPAELEALASRRLAYIDQLAVMADPKYRLCAPALAFRALTRLLEGGCELVFTTVVARPIRNLATLPLLAAVGAVRLGAIDEVYPEVGAIASDVYCISPAALHGDDGDRRRQSRLAALQRWTSRLAGP